MKRMTLNQIENRIAKIELSNPECPGEQFVGRYYDELTDGEKELYFDYLYGVNRGFDHETHESILRYMYDDEEYQRRLHSICEKRERDPTKPMSEKELRERIATVSKEIEQITNETEEERDERFKEYRIHRNKNYI